jgi:hypothetical protein
MCLTRRCRLCIIIEECGSYMCVCGVAFVLFVFCYSCLCTRVFCFLYMNWFQPILTGPEGKIFNTNSATCR